MKQIINIAPRFFRFLVISFDILMIFLVFCVISLGVYTFLIRDELLSKRAPRLSNRNTLFTKDIVVPIFNINEAGGISTYASLLIENFIKKRPNYRFIIPCNSENSYKLAKKFKNYKNALIIKTAYSISDTSLAFIGLSTLTGPLNRWINAWVLKKSDNFNDIFFRLKQKLFCGEIFVDKYIDIILQPNFGLWLDLGIKQILILHDLYFIDMPRMNLLYDPRPMYKEYFDASLKIICISDFVRDSVNRHFTISSDRLITIHNQFARRFPIISAEQEKEVLQRFNLEPHKYFVYTSSFWRHKNHLGLIKGFKKFLKKYHIPPDIKLVLIGHFASEGPSFSVYTSKATRKLVQETGLTGRVVFTSFIDDASVAALTKNAISLVCASFYEGFGMPIAEAMVQETPIISSFCGSLREIGADSVIFFNPFDENDIAAAMNTIFSSSKLRANLIKRGIENAKKYSNTDKMIDEMLDLIEKEIESRKGAKKYEKYWQDCEIAPIKNYRDSLVPLNLFY